MAAPRSLLLLLLPPPVLLGLLVGGGGGGGGAEPAPGGPCPGGEAWSSDLEKCMDCGVCGQHGKSDFCRGSPIEETGGLSGEESLID
ncbi:tumor necrosis factor receptor superfamily member 12A isoform X2 [Struthio camelus]|uniref:tumor necrosis factor receptor superfamily member 12A isoform X2 n=1 Tax=Struthio camelus TaxID=8801 RepID=UPI003603ED6D